jgi:hypothetical protein
MTSDGGNSASRSCRMGVPVNIEFVMGTNNADYSKLQHNLTRRVAISCEHVNAFANLRPQHLQMRCSYVRRQK